MNRQNAAAEPKSDSAALTGVSEATHATIDAVWRIESPKIIGALARLVRDVGLAEELAQDALVIALEKWPGNGVPERPGAWLMKTAKHRALDRFRRDRMIRDKHSELARELNAREDVSVAAIESHIDDDIGDERLALMFATCHPVLGSDSRIALTLKLLCGFSTTEISRAFLTAETSIQQRIVRAKKTLRDADIKFEVPRGIARRERLGSVLGVIYLLFNEGYSAATGDRLMRPQLCREALRLGRMLAELAANEPEALGLVALMELQASRFGARSNSSGDAIPLESQDRRLWDRLLVRRGLKTLDHARSLSNGAGGPYQIQASIAACHAGAYNPKESDWLKIAALYAALMQQSPSPVIELNRAVAIGKALGPQYGLEITDSLMNEPALQNYHLLPAVRGDLLARMDRCAAAAEEFDRAAMLTGNEKERGILRERAQACRDKSLS